MDSGTPTEIANLAVQTVVPSVLRAAAPGDYAYSEDANPATQRTYLVIGHDVKDITEQLAHMQPTPRRREGDVTIAAIDSFAAFAIRYKQTNSVLWADKTAPSIKVAFDYHDRVTLEEGATHQPGGPALPAIGADGETASAPFGGVGAAVLHAYEPPQPRWNKFSATFRFPKAREYVTWEGQNKKRLGQGEFAAFLEENILDVLSPTDTDEGTKALVHQLGLKLCGPSELLRTSRGLQVTSTETVTQAINLSTGEIQVGFQASHGGPVGPDTPNKLDIPNAFVIGIPVFEGSAPFRLLVRLRYNKVEGKLLWNFDIYQLARAYDVAFAEECAAVRDRTGMPLFFATGQ